MKKIILGIGFLIIVFIMGAFFSAQSEPPPLIVDNFVDLNKIEKISRYRSCVGHTTVPQDKSEMKRSMKHYFWVKPEFVGTNAVTIFAPYEGYVSDVRSDPKENLEGEIWIVPKRALPMLPPFGVWQFSVQHIIVRNDLRRGSEVKAGDIIGYAAIPSEDRASFDIVYAKQALIPKMIDNWRSPFSDLDSVFNHMSENVFVQYQGKEISSKEDLIISKEKRNENPCKYLERGPYFSNQDDPSNWVIIL